MRRQILRSLTFVTLMVALYAGLYTLSEVLVLRQGARLFSLPANVRILFVGDSAVECGIDDRLIPAAANVASSGEAYLYTYAKLRGLLRYNPQLKVVYLGYGIHNLDSRGAESHAYSCVDLDHRLPELGPIMGAGDKWRLFLHNPGGFVLATRLEIVANAELLRGRSPRARGLWRMGGYRPNERQDIAADQRHLAAQSGAFRPAASQIEYLRRIADLCRQRSVTLILLNTPKHPLRNAYDDGIAARYWQSLALDQCRAAVLDMSAYPLPESLFANLLHLNTRGAEVFSAILSNEVARLGPALQARQQASPAMDVGRRANVSGGEQMQ